MKILVTGASGFIASQIVTDLLKKGHQITCCARNIPYTKNLFPEAQVIPCDFVNDTKMEDWLSRLEEIDLVINCVGVFYHPKKQVVWNIHYETPKALFDACVQVGVKKIIQISALGVDKTDVIYAASKKAAEDYLQTLAIPSIILRPSFVYAKGAYGGSSLFRGLSGIPFVTPIPGKGTQQFQPIYLNDLSQAVVVLVEKPLDNHLILHAVSQQKVTLTDLLVKMRAWLGFAKAKIIHIPLLCVRISAFFGDFIPYSAMNTGSYKMMQQDNVTTPEETEKFAQHIGFTPKNYSEGLYNQPSTVQDHWHSRLFFLKLPLRFSIAFVWIWTALSCLIFYPKANLAPLLTETGIPTQWHDLTIIAASVLDGVLGLAMLFNIQLKKIVSLQILILLAYTILITLKLPYLWIEPFAPIAKNIPLLVATLICLALESDR